MFLHLGSIDRRNMYADDGQNGFARTLAAPRGRASTSAPARSNKASIGGPSNSRHGWLLRDPAAAFRGASC